MVLESLANPKRAESRPWDLFLVGALYAAVAVFLSLWIFREESSIVMVLLTVIACVPLMYNTIKYEEEKEIKLNKETKILKEHAKVLSFCLFLFLGFVLSFSIAYIVLDTETTTTLFSAQMTTINKINDHTKPAFIAESPVVESGEAVTGQAYAEGLFLRIFGNNVKVLLFCVFFSFFYGAGAIFILTWNATVISAAIGNFFRTHLSSYASSLGFVGVGTYLQIYGLSLLRYFIHGIPEILAYFIGGLAGGVISVAVIRHDFSTQSFGRVLKDAINLILIAVVVLFIAGFIEVYITPRIISG